MIRDTLTKVPIWAWFIIAMVFYTYAEYLSKSWGYKPTLPLASVIVVLYVAEAVCWLSIVLHRNEIARMSSVWQVSTTVLSILVGAVLLGEKMTPTQWVGVALGAVGLYLLS
jgi:multidrug transporter EmrE-like cation transporter